MRLPQFAAHDTHVTWPSCSAQHHNSLILACGTLLQQRSLCLRSNQIVQALDRTAHRQRQ